MATTELPTQPQVEDALRTYLDVVADWTKPTLVYEALAKQFNLSVEQRNAVMIGDGRNHWENRVQYARQRLVDRGIIDGSRYGYWKTIQKSEE